MQIDLLEKAKATIKCNIVLTESGPMMAAGGNQFKSIWVRDFCHSVPGLLKSGYRELVKNQLQTIHRYLRTDYLLPRGLDVANPKIRVLWNLFIKQSPSWMDYAGRKLRPEYFGEHGTPAFDSNLLFILAVESFEKLSGHSTPLFAKNQLRDLFSRYQFANDGLLHQPAYSDWQDSAWRKGPVLLSHLLYLKAAAYLGLDAQVFRVTDSIRQKFYNSTLGLFEETPGSKQISLDSHLFLLNNRISIGGLDLGKIYQTLRSHPIWTGFSIPGVPIFPQYPWREISWTTKLIGLRKYHDGLLWGWLTAEAYACAMKYQDTIEASRILERFFKFTDKDQFLGEIYSHEKDKISLFRSLLYKSEMPFSWTAAKWIEAL